MIGWSLNVMICLVDGDQQISILIYYYPYIISKLKLVKLFFPFICQLFILVLVLLCVHPYTQANAFLSAVL